MRNPVAASVVLLSASLFLAGFSSQPADDSPPIAKSTVALHSTPAFLSTPQTATDKLGSTVKGIDGASTRYQGTVHGTKIFLGVAGGASGANMVELIYSSAKGWGFGGGLGNGVTTMLLPHGDWVEYIPQGATAKTLKGFVPLSKWIIVRQH
jgi:hypothetical protein